MGMKGSGKADMDVVFVSSEAAPYVKTGGLGDVAFGLPQGLSHEGVRVTVFIPLYKEVLECGMAVADTGLRVGVTLGGAGGGSGSVVEGEIWEAATDERGGGKGGTTPKVYLIRCDDYFLRDGIYQAPDGRDHPDNLERFTFFTRGVLEGVKALGLKPDLIHCNDWQTALIPVYLKTLYKDDPSLSGISTLLTIHNLGHQGVFPYEGFHLTGLPPELFHVDRLEYWGSFSTLKGGVLYSDAITTVSEGYRDETLTESFGFGFEGILRERAGDYCGILNGVDYGEWDPEKDPLIEKNYSDANIRGKGACKLALMDELSISRPPGVKGVVGTPPLVGIVSRLTDQKGTGVVLEAIDRIMAEGVNLALLGSGDKAYEEGLKKAGERHRGGLSVTIGFDNTLAHRIEAGADIFLMPSSYEPCGLNQMYSLKYGTIPIVTPRGGLDDTIIDASLKGGNGFKMEDLTEEALITKVREAAVLYKDRRRWRRLQKSAFGCDFSWDVSARSYIDLYCSLKG